jgi:hypothetical protein
MYNGSRRAPYGRVRVTRCGRIQVRWLVVMMALLFAPAAGSKAYAGNPVDKHELTRRVAEAAKMLAGHPNFRGMSDTQRARAVEFITGNLIFVLGHEAGHAVIREMKIPVVGREEEAADVFATLMALMCTDEFSDRVLANAALGWFFSDRRDRRRGEKMEYYGEHNMDIQRAYYIVCLMVGSNMGKFGGIATVAKLPEERQKTCADEYLGASWSWEKVLEPHLRKPDEPRSEIKIVYGPGGGKFDIHAKVSQHIRALEAIADNLTDRFVWKTPITFEMKACGESNARWEIYNKRVVMCYELADEYAELYRQFGRTMNFSLDQKVSAVTPQVRAAVGQKKKALRARRPVR